MTTDLDLDDDTPPERPDYWESRYRARRTVWDLGHPAPALSAWLAAAGPRRGRAMVLGCGRGYDALALAGAGFEVTAVDFAPSAIADAERLAAEAGLRITFLQRDVFDLGPEYDQAFDLLFEHTCFCVFEPARRPAYRDLAARLLRPGGVLLGVFFTGDRPDGPPFGVTPDALEALFGRDFELRRLTPVATTDDHAFEAEHLGEFVRRAEPGQITPSPGDPDRPR